LLKKHPIFADFFVLMLKFAGCEIGAYFEPEEKDEVWMENMSLLENGP